MGWQRTVFDPRRPFSRADARAAGLPLHRLLSREFHRVCFDQYVVASVPITLPLRAQAALNISPAGSQISHHTAAALWGAIVPPSPDVHVSLLTENGRCIRRGVRSHISPRGSQATNWRSLRMSTPEQTFLDLASVGVNLVDLVVAGDSLVKKKRTEPERLVAAAAGWSGRGCRTARRAAGLVRSDVDSPMESRLRMLVVLAGLPEPTVNLILRRPDGEWERRFDMAVEKYRLLLEYDGRQHAEDDEQWLSDIYRRRISDRMEYRLVVVTSEGIYVDPLRTLQRYRAALIPTSAPPTFRDDSAPSGGDTFPGADVNVHRASARAGVASVVVRRETWRWSRAGVASVVVRRGTWRWSRAGVASVVVRRGTWRWSRAGVASVVVRRGTWRWSRAGVASVVVRRGTWCWSRAGRAPSRRHETWRWSRAGVASAVVRRET